MEGYCNECKCKTALKGDLNICYNCYEEMFKTTMPNPFEDIEEPDFVLGSDVAEINATDKTVLYVPNMGSVEFKKPKAYVIDMDTVKTDKDLAVLLSAVLSELTFFDSHKDFEYIKRFLKEAE